MGGPKQRYAGLLDVYEELDQATAIHRRLGCPVLDVSDFSVEETAMRVIKLVADRQRKRRTPIVSGKSLWRAEGRSIDEKGWVPLRYWSMWFGALGFLVVVFYVILTPVWIGLRAPRGWPSSGRGAPR